MSSDIWRVSQLIWSTHFKNWWKLQPRSFHHSAKKNCLQQWSKWPCKKWYNRPLWCATRVPTLIIRDDFYDISCSNLLMDQEISKIFSNCQSLCFYVHSTNGSVDFVAIDSIDFDIIVYTIEWKNIFTWVYLKEYNVFSRERWYF